MKHFSIRTHKSIVNSRTALSYTLASYIVAFFGRSILLHNLGDDIMGLNSTLNNLLQVLNIAELGLVSAISATLYKPFAMHDYHSVNAIVAVQRWYYRRIGLFVICAGAAIMPFFPFIFHDITFPLAYAYAGFTVVLANSALFYFVNYKRILLSASQKEYIVYRSYNSVLILKALIQMAAVAYLPYKYEVWLAIELLFTMAASLSLHCALKRNARYYHKIDTPIDTLDKQYPRIRKMIKQLAFHKIGGFSLTQATPLIIFAYSSLSMVTAYYNYQLIFAAFTMFIATIFGATNSSIGNLVAKESPRKVSMVFKEIYSVQFLLVSTICAFCLSFSSDIVSIWLGKQYVIASRGIISAMVVCMFFASLRTVIDNFINSYGIFDDVWAPIAEAATNVSLSLWLGYNHGIFGVIIGIAISQFLFTFIWKPVYLFIKGFRISPVNYLWLIFRYIIIGIFSILVSSTIIGFIDIHTDSIFDTICRMVVFTLLYFIFCYLLLTLSCTGMRMFNRRISRLIRKNK